MPPCFPRRYVSLGLFLAILIAAGGLFTGCAAPVAPPAATPIPLPTATPPPAADPKFAVTPVGLIRNEPEASPGYTLFNWIFGNRAYLIDNSGRVVHTWDLGGRVRFAKLLVNGDLLVGTALSAQGGRSVRIIAPDGAVKWNYPFPGWHHDLLPMPNGNVLLLAKERKTAREAIAAGVNPACVDQRGVDFESLVEVRPTGPTEGEVVWKWSVWDHLIQDFDPSKANYGVVAEHPELVDVNFRQCEKSAVHPHDWIHANSIDYHPERDQLLISARNLGEVWVIDHGTTTEEAAGRAGGRAGKGGGLLYRWGNPQAYRAGSRADQRLFWAHDAQWIPPGLPGAGNILVFNNGLEYADARRYYSSIEEFTPPAEGLNYRLEPSAAYGPAEPVWRYIADPPGSFYAPLRSGAQRLPNGNTLICDSAKSSFFEVTPAGEVVWQYINPVVENTPLRQGDPMPILVMLDGVPQWANRVYRIVRYAPDYPGLRGLDLTPGNPIELYE